MNQGENCPFNPQRPLPVKGGGKHRVLKHVLQFGAVVRYCVSHLHSYSHFWKSDS